MDRRQQAEQTVGAEWAEWYFMTPQERWRESCKLWETYPSIEGSLDPEPDTQSPFFDAGEWRAFLLMGGQACVFYGAAEFSRDLDLIILLDGENLDRLRAVLAGLEAVPIAIPDLDQAELLRGHAVHFRCLRSDAAGLRIDLMARLRGVPPFEQLWDRRTTIQTEGVTVDLLSLQDLVLAKKTQRDKDWSMLRRLVEQSYFSTLDPPPETVGFWLAELRSPDLLLEVAANYPHLAAQSPRPTGCIGSRC